MLVGLGPLGGGGSGSLGHITFSHNRYGSYARARTKPVNPASSPQGIVRAIMSDAANAWASLSAGDKAGWGAYAAAIPWKNRLGATVHLTGPAMFRSCYVARVRAEMPAVTTPPATLLLPGQDSTFGVAATASNQHLSISFSTALSWVTQAGSVLAYSVGIPQALTTNFYKGPWLYLGRTIGNSGTPPTSPVTVTSNRVFQAGQKLWIRGRICLADGRVSSPFDTFCVTAA